MIDLKHTDGSGKIKRYWINPNLIESMEPWGVGTLITMSSGKQHSADDTPQTIESRLDNRRPYMPGLWEE